MCRGCLSPHGCLPGDDDGLKPARAALGAYTAWRRRNQSICSRGYAFLDGLPWPSDFSLLPIRTSWFIRSSIESMCFSFLVQYFAQLLRQHLCWQMPATFVLSNIDGKCWQSSWHGQNSRNGMAQSRVYGFSQHLLLSVGSVGFQSTEEM